MCVSVCDHSSHREDTHKLFSFSSFSGSNHRERVKKRKIKELIAGQPSAKTTLCVPRSGSFHEVLAYWPAYIFFFIFYFMVRTQSYWPQSGRPCLVLTINKNEIKENIGSFSAEGVLIAHNDADFWSPVIERCTPSFSLSFLFIYWPDRHFVSTPISGQVNE